MKNWTIALLILLIGIEIYNFITLTQLKKLAKQKKKYIPDERYFELKSKFQLYTTVGAIALLLFTFFGWDSRQNLNNIRDEYQASIKTIVDEFTK